MTLRFSASAAPRLMHCRGSANLEEAIPGYEEPQRDDMAGAKGVGTRIHAALEMLFRIPLDLTLAEEMIEGYARIHWRQRREINVDLVSAAKWLGYPPTAEVPIEVTYLTMFLVALDHDENLPPKMLRFIADTIRYMKNLQADLGVSRRDVETEVKMKSKWLRKPEKTTADVVIPTRNTLDVVDYKTGSIPVEAEDNDQLMYYAACAKYEFYEDSEWPSTITMHILQPGNESSHTITAGELKKWIVKARATERLIAAGDLSLHPGKGCTFCPANPHTRGDKATKLCPVMMEMLYPPVMDADELLAEM